MEYETRVAEAGLVNLPEKMFPTSAWACIARSQLHAIGAHVHTSCMPFSLWRSY